MTVETTNIDQVRKVGSKDFAQFSNQTDGTGFLNIIRLGDDWALIGPYGLFQDENGISFFTDLEELHRRVSGWGFKHFFQEGAYYVFLGN